MRKNLLTSILFLISIGLLAQKAGTFDSTFNATGLYIEPANVVGDNVYLDIQPDGKLVVTGSTDLGTQIKYFVMRFNPDGTKDTNFGTDGALVGAYNTDDMIVKDMLIHEDGKIVIVGHFNPAFKGFMVRINPDGTLDTSFGWDGYVITNVYADATESITGVDMQYDENGNWGYMISGTYKRPTADAKLTSYLARYFASGTSFDNNFSYSEDVFYGSETHSTDNIVLEDNAVLTAGWYDDPANTTRYFYVSKKLSTGEADESFGRNSSIEGFTELNFNNGYLLDFHEFSTMNDGSILLVGEYKKANETLTDYDIFVLRTTADGELDWAYGEEGQPYLNYEFTPAGYDKAYTIDEINDGKTLIGGCGNSTDAGIVCLDYFGRVDTSFGENGQMLFDVQGDLDIILSSALSLDTSVLYVAGRTYNTDESKTDIFIAAIHTKTVVKEPVDPDAIDLNQHKEITVWPNPVQQAGIIHIEFPWAKMENLQLQLLNINGALIKNYSLNGHRTNIKLPHNLSKGIYFLSLSGPDFKVNSKLIIQ